jgi:peptidoglycan glycosyltransferase
VNSPIFRLFVLFAALFAVLIGFSSRWSVFGATGLRENPHNSRVVLEEQRIKRGVIRAADGTVLAGSTALSGGRFTRRYPTGPLFAQAVGFDDVIFGRAGLEKQYNDALVGRKEELGRLVDSLVDKRVVGDDLRTTLDPKAQQAAYDAMQGRKGAVVALDVKSGAVRVLAGAPSFDPKDPGKKGTSTFNNATQGLYPPGSTFKTVTASAAIDSGRYQPDSLVSGKNGKIISGTPLNNFGRQNFGDITLTEALTHSVNTVWAEVGVKLGRSRMQEYMDRFGFGRKPPMDYPDGQMSTSGPKDRKGKLIPISSSRVDVGRTAIGQGLLLVTPLQMATVAQTIGNGGLRMEPRLVEKVVDPDGRTVEEPLPKEAERVMSSESAAKVATMMKSVVREGSGTAAALQGVELAGKTGTAEIDINRGINDLWFIGFTDEVAVAVIIDREQGQGGTVAAPIAKRVLQALGQ